MKYGIVQEVMKVEERKAVRQQIAMRPELQRQNSTAKKRAK